jgi:hypothetical protein
MYVLQWIGVIGTESPIRDRVVFGVSLVHRLIERLVLRSAHTLTAIGESLKEETIQPLGNEENLHLHVRPTGRDIGRISGLRIGPRSRRERQYLGTVGSRHMAQPASITGRRQR